jgi:hypothetical protein
MHVEAMNWSGVGHAEDAAALGLSPHAPRKRRDRFEDSEVEMDWCSLLHPSAQAQLSSAANCAAALATLSGLVRPPDGMLAIELEMGSEARAKTGRYCVVFVIFSPSLRHSRYPRCQRKPELQNRHCGRCCLQKTGAFQVSNSCPTSGENECWRRNFGIESGAHGHHFSVGKLATEHDAAGCVVLWATRNWCLTWKVFALWIAGCAMVFGQE